MQQENEHSFLAVAAKEMNTAVLKSEYSDKIEATHGRAPYTFKRKSGSMPTGVKLNETTGELTGTPTRAGDYTFTVQVTDAVGDTAERQFNLQVIDSNIISVEKLNSVNVKRGETPVLPSQVTVTYKDKTTGKGKCYMGESRYLYIRCCNGERYDWQHRLYRSCNGECREQKLY